MRHHLSALITYARFVSWVSGSSVGIAKVARLATAQIGVAGIMGLLFARSRPCACRPECFPLARRLGATAATIATTMMPTDTSGGMLIHLSALSLNAVKTRIAASA